MDDIGYQSPIIEGRRRRSSKKKIIVILFVVLLLAVPLGIGGYHFLHVSADPSSTPTPMPTAIAFPTDTPTPTLQATPTAVVTPTGVAKKTTTDSKSGINKATIHIIIENGSGVVGAANKAASLLKDAGYTITAIKNADNYDYQDVTISVKSANASYLSLLKQDISSEYTVSASNTSLDASSSADALVIIGK